MMALQKCYLFTILFALLFFVPQTVWAYHSELDGLLKDYVVPSEKNNIRHLAINYDAWAEDPRHEIVKEAILNTQTDAFASDAAKRAFWLNAYNFLIIDMIIETGERESIQNQGDTFKTPFSTYVWPIGGKDYTLGQIRDKILYRLDEPRLMFAMNSGSISCPDIRREVYRSTNLEAQLRDQTIVTFKNKAKGLKFEKRRNVVRVPRYMEWYRRAFPNSDVKAWLQTYYPNHINHETRIGYFEFDWAMNDLE